MDIADAFREIGMAMGGSVVNRDNGCLEFCDGTPDALVEEQKSILLASADLIKGEPDQAQIDGLVERAQRFGTALTQIENVCAVECGGAFNLFDSEEERYDKNGNPVKRPCPKRDRLASIPLGLPAPEL